MANEKDLPEWDESFVRETDTEDDIEYELDIDDEDFEDLEDWDDVDLEEVLEDAEDIDWEE